MLKKCNAIVIGTLNYSENSVILKCFTDLHGLQSYLINGVKGNKAAIRPSQLMPLTLLELEVYHQHNKNLHRIKELKCTPVLSGLHFDMVKSAIGMFIAELTGKCLRNENEEDRNLFNYLFNAIQILDVTNESLANFPVFFMIQLSKYLGFYPKMNYSAQANSFSLYEGIFIPYNPAKPDVCNPTLSFILFELIGARFETFSQIRISHADRMILLDRMIRYFKLHLMVFGELNSPKILNVVMA
ncbi:MAG: DNA repair protein RecO [Bacteroidia bacterium]|nr:DNA repair protein RecO [Bacteroidia bacterium]